MDAAPNSDGHRFVFVGGLHRSGTTIVTNCLAEHPAISGFHDTGAREDEGQFLQSVYPTAGEYGGPGRFGFDARAHLTEASSLVTPANAARMLDEWSAYWSLDRPVLLEKSPPNIIRNRFLQALFPQSWFVVVVRHPVAVSFATYTRRPKKTELHSLFEHWAVCHDELEADLPHIRRSLVVPYERFVVDPDGWLARLYEFLELEPHARTLEIKRATNDPYFESWRAVQAQRGIGPQASRAKKAREAAAALEPRVRRWGYSFEDLALDAPITAVGAAG